MSHYIQLFLLVVMQMYIILNPPSVIAIMLGLTKSSTPDERLQMSKKICLIGGLLLFVFAFLGKFILEDVFQISTEAFQVGGGLFLLTIGLSMLLSQDSDEGEDSNAQENPTKKVDPSSLVITPLATPLLVGPGTITATLVKRAGLDSFGDIVVFYLALLAALILVFFSFVLGCKFSKYLTPSILKVIERLVGLLLTCIAIRSILSGLQTFSANL